VKLLWSKQSATRTGRLVATAFVSALLLANTAAEAQQRVVRVITTQVAAEDFPYEIEALGTARANESIEVTSKVAEVITAIRFEEGGLVKAGDVLVELANHEATANLAIARANAIESRSQYERGQQLAKTRSISPSELQQLKAIMDANSARVKAAEARLADLTITAPFDGRVGLRRVSLGSLISPGTVITTLDDLSVIKLDFAVPEVALAPLQPGLAVNARSVAFPDTSFDGKIASIDTRIDPVTRAVRVRALLDNDDALLKPGMFLTVQVLRRGISSLMIPEQALVPIQDRQYVFVIDGTTAHQREIQTGRRRPGQVEVIDGLAAGEIVVIEGNQNLREGSAVEMVERSVSAGTS
jgi:membrane fusion protein (multidrug efflux system)